MVSDQYRCIFVEVPKTGSTSIRQLIGEPKRPHLNIWQIAYDTPREVFHAYFKFGFVRNPWDRAVSLYERREGMQMRDRMNFEQFVDWMKYASATSVHPVPHRYQLDWFVNPHGDLMMDFIGRFESIDKDWTFIAQKVGAPAQLPMLNQNPRKTRHYSSYYTERSRRVIAERFAVDIEYFGYQFEG